MQPSTVAKHLNSIQPAWNNEAERVVAIQKRMQAVSLAFLNPVLMDGQSYVLKALQPLEDHIPLIIGAIDCHSLNLFYQAGGRSALPP